jgi:hypothetical protein
MGQLVCRYAVAGESSHAEESLCSLRFGERMAVVRNSPTVVVDSDAVGLCTRKIQLTHSLQAPGFLQPF